jgi:hypothetical protein
MTSGRHQITQHIRCAALALRDIAPFGRNVVYAGNVNKRKILQVVTFVRALSS